MVRWSASNSHGAAVGAANSSSQVAPEPRQPLVGGWRPSAAHSVSAARWPRMDASEPNVSLAPVSTPCGATSPMVSTNASSATAEPRSSRSSARRHVFPVTDSGMPRSAPVAGVEAPPDPGVGHPSDDVPEAVLIDAEPFADRGRRDEVDDRGHLEPAGEQVEQARVAASTELAERIERSAMR